MHSKKADCKCSTRSKREKKKLPSEELEQMKAVSNVIKQRGVVTEDYHEPCFTQCWEENMVKP